MMIGADIHKSDLINGNITKSILRFALPLMFGNLLQQCYNIADTLIVGRVLGAKALAAVGSSYAIYHISLYWTLYGVQYCFFYAVRCP